MARVAWRYFVLRLDKLGQGCRLKLIVGPPTLAPSMARRDTTMTNEKGATT